MNLAQAPNAPRRPCGKQWVPQGRLAERRGREERGSGRLPGGGGRGQGAQSRERITTGACPERVLCDYERARRGPEPSPHLDEEGSWAPVFLHALGTNEGCSRTACSRSAWHFDTCQLMQSSQ